MRNGDLLGVLNVESRYINAFDERSMHLLELFGDAAVLAFEIALSREIVNVAVRLAEMTLEDFGQHVLSSPRPPRRTAAPWRSCGSTIGKNTNLF